MHEIYRTGIERLAAAGGNAVRVILDTWWLPLEMAPDYPAPGYPHGVPGFTLGRYNAANAWLVDRIVEIAGRHGVYVTLVAWDGQGSWGGARYALPEVFDEDLVRRRLRYQVARWGYADQVSGWELFNEADVDPAEPAYRRTVEWLRATDVRDRLVLNSWRGIDAAETHSYPCGPAESDPASRFHWCDCPKESDFLHLARFSAGDGRPHLLSEYGEKWYFRLPLDTDPHAHRAREGLWAALTGGMAGAQYWWFHGHLYPADAFDAAYRGAAGLLRDVDLGRYRWQGARFAPLAGPGGLVCRGMVCREVVRAGTAAGAGTAALLWFVRTPSDEATDRLPANGNRFRVGDLPPAAYLVRWWDTAAGEPLRTEPAGYRDGGVALSVPDGVTRDIAAQLLVAPRTGDR